MAWGSLLKRLHIKSHLTLIPQPPGKALLCVRGALRPWRGPHIVQKDAFPRVTSDNPWKILNAPHSHSQSLQLQPPSLSLPLWHNLDSLEKWLFPPPASPAGFALLFALKPLLCRLPAGQHCPFLAFGAAQSIYFILQLFFCSNLQANEDPT